MITIDYYHLTSINAKISSKRDSRNVYICSMETTPITPLSVANYFIQKSIDEGKLITSMKLVKLVYIAHGWHLGLFKKPLLPESAQAWTYGPVIPTIYHKFKHYGNTSITELESGPLHDNKFSIGYPTVNDDNLKLFLNQIWESYKGFSAIELSSMTHKEGTPWFITWHNNGGKSNSTIPIPNDLIESHYQSKATSVDPIPNHE